MPPSEAGFQKEGTGTLQAVILVWNRERVLVLTTVQISNPSEKHLGPWARSRRLVAVVFSPSGAKRAEPHFGRWSELDTRVGGGRCFVPGAR